MSLNGKSDIFKAHETSWEKEQNNGKDQKTESTAMK